MHCELGGSGWRVGSKRGWVTVHPLSSGGVWALAPIGLHGTVTFHPSQPSAPHSYSTSVITYEIHHSPTQALRWTLHGDYPTRSSAICIPLSDDKRSFRNFSLVAKSWTPAGGTFLPPHISPLGRAHCGWMGQCMMSVRDISHSWGSQNTSPPALYCADASWDYFV